MIAILIVDDNVAVRALLRTVLDAQPAFSVVGEAGDGMAACQIAQQLRPDIILMDINMPRMNGIESTRCIRALSPKTLIIGMSADTSPGMRGECLSAGAQAFLPKQLIATHLMAVVNQELSP